MVRHAELLVENKGRMDRTNKKDVSPGERRQGPVDFSSSYITYLHYLRFTTPLQILKVWLSKHKNVREKGSTTTSCKSKYLSEGRYTLK